MYQMNQTELSSLECGIRICLQADAGVVFLQFPSRETFFCFWFTFGVPKILNETHKKVSIQISVGSYHTCLSRSEQGFECPIRN